MNKNRTPLTRPTALLLILLLPLAVGGCPLALAGGAAAGALAYDVGELSTTRNVTLSRAYSAGLAALEDLGVIVVTREKDGLSALLVAHGAEDKKITIRMKKIFDDVTRIGIRVGYFGDELQSRLIYQRMEAHLEELNATSRAPAIAPGLP